MNAAFDTPLHEVPGLNKRLVQLFEQELHVSTVEDALLFLPFRYVDRRFFVPVDDVRTAGEMLQVVGVATRVQVVGQGRKQRLVVSLQGERQRISLVWFRGIRYYFDRVRIGSRYVAYGKVDLFGTTLTITHPELDLYTEELQKKAAVEGVYSSTAKLNRMPRSQKAIAELIRGVLQWAMPEVEDVLDERFYTQYGLMPLREALRSVHFPRQPSDVDRALWRLKFEEVFFLQLRMQLAKAERHSQNVGITIPRVGPLFNQLYKEELPFDLTGAQKRVLREVYKDVRSGRQMNRLLQGDVGSGKTLVSLFSMLLAIDNGCQACLMAPTEILAQQHFATLSRFTERLKVRIALLMGSTKKRERESLHAGLQSGEIDILIGTHAVIEDEVRFHNLGIVVIDEQHRFGVQQRARLWAKGANCLPHILVMTATPIPRTLAMTQYGDLDVSVIDELPPGRKPIQTMHAYEEQRFAVYTSIAKELAQGRQAYVVYPLIEENEKMDLASLEEGFLALKRFFEPQGYYLAMLHGRMKPEEKSLAMGMFSSNRAQILVSTTVIEVGVDVPNATVMLIESAQRFGLSQLHQLRGRVGRGGEKSYCILMTSRKLSAMTRARVEIMVQSNNGFEIAEADLRLRGPGDVEGTQQSGVGAQFRITSLENDGQLIAQANAMALTVVGEDPELASEKNAKIRAEMQRRAAGRRYGQVG